MTLGLYDPKDCSVLVGTLTVDGYGDGDAISLEPPTETVLAKRGVMGEYAIALKGDRLFSLKVNLHQTASCNASLRSLYRAQFRAGWSPYNVSFRNKRTGETWRGVGWITADGKLPTGEAVQNVEWDIGFLVGSAPGDAT